MTISFEELENHLVENVIGVGRVSDRDSYIKIFVVGDIELDRTAARDLARYFGITAEELEDGT